MVGGIDKPRGPATGIVVFQDGEGGGLFPEFGHQVYGGIDIQKVVVGELFRVQLFEQPFKIPVEYALLMGVFTIPKRPSLHFAHLEGRYIRAAVEVVEDGRVIMGGNIKCLCCKLLPLLQGGGAFPFLQQREEGVVIRHGGHAEDILVILGSRPDE